MTKFFNMKIWVAKLLLDSLAKYSAVLTAFVLPLSTALTEIMFVVTVVLNLAAGNWREKYDLIAKNRVALIMLLFFALFILGLTYSTAPFIDSLKMLGKYDKILFAVLFMPLFIDEKWRKKAINAFIVSVSLILIAAYSVIISHHYAWFLGKYVDYFAAKHIFYSLIIAFAAYLLILKIYDVKDLKHRLIYGLLLILMLFYLFFMQDSRSGYWVFFGLLILFCLQIFGKKGLLFAGISLVLLIGLVSFSPVFKGKLQQTISEVKTYQQNSFTSIGLRMEFAANSIYLLKQHPILGTGTGSFAHEYATLKPKSGVLTTNPHNQYLFMGVEFGVLGILVLLLMFGWQLWYSRYLPKDVKFIAQGLVLAIMLGSLANSWIFDANEGHFYAFFVAVTFAALQFKKPILKLKI